LMRLQRPGERSPPRSIAREWVDPRVVPLLRFSVSRRLARRRIGSLVRRSPHTVPYAYVPSQGLPSVGHSVPESTPRLPQTLGPLQSTAQLSRPGLDQTPPARFSLPPALPVRGSYLHRVCLTRISPPSGFLALSTFSLLPWLLGPLSCRVRSWDSFAQPFRSENKPKLAL
jgi:hypothetical protein